MSDLVHDVFSHEGDMDFAYMHEDFLSAKILQKNFNDSVIASALS